MNSNNNTNPKCSNCKCYFLPEIKSSGQPFKTCDKCRTRDKEAKNNNKCEHGKRRASCVKCGGGEICEHKREKYKCKQCGGSQICEHDKIKYKCKQCGGSQICEHDKIKSMCKQCGGSQICEHDKYKPQCKQCGGSQICEHDKIKSRCKQCGASHCGGIHLPCIHDKRKAYCKECGGSSFCIHDKRKSNCKLCNFKLYFINLQRSQIKRFFKLSISTKNKHSIEYLGCNIEEFIQYFQKKMDYFNTYLSTSERMKFNNVHIEHIKPVSKFNLDDTDEFLDCCHYSILQPLLITINLEKSNKWSEKNNKYWLDNIKGKEYHEIYIP
jgi:hypothetical protein